MPVADHRRFWVESLLRVASPVYKGLSEALLCTQLPVAKGEQPGRHAFAPLEAVGRTLAGIGPWLETRGLAGDEAVEQQRLAAMVREGLAHAVEPGSPDFLNFTDGGQPLVDSAFLALGLVRSRNAVWDKLDVKTRCNLVRCLRETRRVAPPFNNWLLFAAMIESFLCSVGEEWDVMRVDYALRQHEQWYKGDGNYGDGPFHHWDYYNSFVIQPFLLEILRICAPKSGDWQRLEGPMIERARRYAAVQERMIAPDGSFPPLGRSLTYRFGVFHHLALMALWDKLPEGVAPAQVRCGLTAVLERLLSASGTFDVNGWLTLGLAGCQPSLGESYISTGSLYLFATGFLPMGLAPEHPFWAGAEVDWTAKKVWSGQGVEADHSLNDGAAHFLSPK